MSTVQENLDWSTRACQ